jgi:adenylate kinase family enzyme
VRRVVVLGCAGTGKTTFARALAAKLGAPAIVLDDIWQADWGPDHTQAFRDLLTEAHAGETWVSDGNFAVVSFDLRLPRADLVVWLERPRWLCMLRAARRVWRPGEAHRPADLAKVFAFIWNFDRINRPRIEAALQEHGPSLPVVRLRSDRAAADFLAAAAV